MWQKWAKDSFWQAELKKFVSTWDAGEEARRAEVLAKRQQQQPATPPEPKPKLEPEPEPEPEPAQTDRPGPSPADAKSAAHDAQEPEPEQTQQQQELGQEPQTSGIMGIELAQAEYAYEAANEGDLSLSEGEKLRILPFSPELEAQYGALGEGWAFGESVSSGERGVFPEGYVRRLGPEGAPELEEQDEPVEDWRSLDDYAILGLDREDFVGVYLRQTTAARKARMKEVVAAHRAQVMAWQSAEVNTSTCQRRLSLGCPLLTTVALRCRMRRRRGLRSFRVPRGPGLPGRRLRSALSGWSASTQRWTASWPRRSEWKRLCFIAGPDRRSRRRCWRRSPWPACPRGSRSSADP